MITKNEYPRLAFCSSLTPAKIEYYENLRKVGINAVSICMHSSGHEYFKYAVIHTNLARQAGLTTHAYMITDLYDPISDVMTLTKRLAKLGYGATTKVTILVNSDKYVKDRESKIVKIMDLMSNYHDRSCIDLAFFKRDLDDHLYNLDKLPKMINLTIINCTPGASSFDFSKQNADLFAIIDWLINDFVKLGIYKETKKKIHKSAKGKILWQQTINLITPLFYKNNLIYSEFYSQYQNKEDAFLTIIHKTVISDIAEKYGVFFNQFAFNNNTEQLDFSNTDVLKQAKTYLVNTLYRTNMRRTKLLIQNIIKYLDHILSGDSDLGITTQYFYATFEKAVRKFFHDKNHDTDQEEIEKNLKEGLPKATWNFKINGNLYPSNRYL